MLLISLHTYDAITYKHKPCTIVQSRRNIMKAVMQICKMMLDMGQPLKENKSEREINLILQLKQRQETNFGRTCK